MKILGIDTSTSFAGVGLSVDGEVSTHTWWSRHNHGREVMPAVMRLFDAAGIEACDLDAVAVALGPGGFSAVRVGIATGQGLVAPTGKPLIGVPTHLVQAFPHWDVVGKRIVSLIPIGRNQVSYAVYNPLHPDRFKELGNGILVNERIGSDFGDDSTLLCGEGATIFEPNDDAAVNKLPRSPKHLIEIAIEQPKQGVVFDDFVEPVYSRPPTITAPKRM